MDFWNALPKPFFVLAPLDDVTDPAFRRIIAKYSKPAGPAIMYTEFVAADGLALAPEEGRKKLMKDLEYSEAERPIVAQFFSGVPEHMEKAAALAREMGFDGVDINMGCPIDQIIRQDSGSGLIRKPELAKEIIAATKRGAKDLPVSVKTRIGFNSDETETWIPALLSAKPVSITIHARTKKEMSLVPARWDRVKRAVELRNELAPEVLILGNGDAKDLPDARAKAAESGADGVMLGRAIFGNPWLFAETVPALSEKLRVLVEHTKLYEELLPEKSFAFMKKHYKAYVTGFDGAAELRARLMDAPDAAGVEKIVEEYLAGLTE